jgi:hypothetical protein
VNGFEVTRVENGFVVHEGTNAEYNYGYPRKRWVAKDPKELAELIYRLMQPMEKKSGNQANDAQASGQRRPV